MPSISPEKKAIVARAWQDLIVAVAEGAHIGNECAKHGITRYDVRHYRLQDAQAEREWQAAREQSADTFADQIGDMANNPPIDSARARIQLDALRWLAAKRNPRVYSDKATLDVNVKTVDLTRIIQDANARLAAAQAPRIIEAEVVRDAIAPALLQLSDLLE